MVSDNKARTKKLALLLLIVILGLLVFSVCAEAAIRDSWNKTKNSVGKVWGEVSKFIKSGKFWINALLIAMVGIVLAMIFLKDKMSDNTTKVILYILIGILALAISSKVVVDGKPEYIWKSPKLRDATQFLIGPTKAQPNCAYASRWDQIKDTAGGFASGLPLVGSKFEKKPPCCGTGAYWKDQYEYFKGADGKQQKRVIGQVCKQAILRNNDTGAGLYAFIISAILLYILFSWLFKKIGSGST